MPVWSEELKLDRVTQAKVARNRVRQERWIKTTDPGLWSVCEGLLFNEQL